MLPAAPTSSCRILDPHAVALHTSQGFSPVYHLADDVTLLLIPQPDADAARRICVALSALLPVNDATVIRLTPDCLYYRRPYISN